MLFSKGFFISLQLIYAKTPQDYYDFVLFTIIEHKLAALNYRRTDVLLYICLKRDVFIYYLAVFIEKRHFQEHVKDSKGNVRNVNLSQHFIASAKITSAFKNCCLTVIMV